MCRPLRASQLRSSSTAWLFVLAIGLVCAQLAAAQPMEAGLASVSPVGGTDLQSPCSEGIVRDDSTIENGYSWVPSVLWGVYAQAFQPEEFPFRDVDSVCVCFLRTQTDDSIDFDVVFYEDAGGVPALEPYAAIPGRAEGVPQGLVGQFVEVDTTGVSVSSDGPTYIGVRWNASVDRFFFICDDQSPETPFTDLFFIDDRAEEWDAASTTVDPIFDAHRAALIRAVPRAPTVVEVPLGPWVPATLAALLLVGAAILLRRGA